MARTSGSLSLSRQLEVFDNYADEEFEALVDDMLDRKQELIAVARERLISGYELYRDLMFTWDEETRDRNIVEEIADAVNYRISRYS